MRIAFLIQDITTEGGTERTTCCLATELARRGHEVAIVSIFRNEQKPRYTADRVQMVYLTDSPYTIQESAPRRFIKAYGLRKRVYNCNILQSADIIICQKIVATFMAYLAGYSQKAIACEHFKYAMYNAPIRSARRWLYAHFRAIVTLTEKDRQLFMQEGLKKVYCIPNMVSINPLPYHGFKSHRIVSVGRLTPQKGYDLLIDAVAQIADKMEDFYIEIYGSGEMKEQLEKQCAQLNISQRIRFCGYHETIEKIYAESAFYIMSSRFEGFPMVLLEAAAAGLPIVSFDCPEGPSILLKNGGGILVKKENISALSAAILKMIQEPAFRALCHQQSEAIVLPYRPEQIGSEWEQLIIQTKTTNSCKTIN